MKEIIIDDESSALKIIEINLLDKELTHPPMAMLQRIEAGCLVVQI